MVFPSEYECVYFFPVDLGIRRQRRNFTIFLWKIYAPLPPRTLSRQILAKNRVSENEEVSIMAFIAGRIHADSRTSLLTGPTHLLDNNNRNSDKNNDFDNRDKFAV